MTCIMYVDTTYYDMDENKIYNNLEIKENDLSQRDFMFKFNQSILHLNFVQRDKIRENITNKLIEKFNEFKKPYSEIKDNTSNLNEFYLYKNQQIDTSKDFIIKDGNYSVKFKNIFILEEIVNDHYFIKKKYQQDGIVNECHFCKQRCKME